MTKYQSKAMRSFQIKMITQIEQGKFESINLKNDIYVKWLAGYMADNLIPFRIIPLGGGVIRITKETCICPRCQGRGYMPEKACA